MLVGAGVLTGGIPVVGVVLTTLSVVLAPFTHGFDLARVGVWAIQQQEFTTVALQQAAQPSPATVVPSAVAQPSVVPIVQPLNIEPTARPSIFSRTTFPWNVLNTTLVITIVTLAAFTYRIDICGSLVSWSSCGRVRIINHRITVVDYYRRIYPVSGRPRSSMGY